MLTGNIIKYCSEKIVLRVLTCFTESCIQAITPTLMEAEHHSRWAEAAISADSPHRGAIEIQCHPLKYFWKGYDALVKIKTVIHESWNVGNLRYFKLYYSIKNENLFFMLFCFVTSVREKMIQMAEFFYFSRQQPEHYPDDNVAMWNFSALSRGRINNLWLRLFELLDVRRATGLSLLTYVMFSEADFRSSSEKCVSQQTSQSQTHEYFPIIPQNFFIITKICLYKTNKL